MQNLRQHPKYTESESKSGPRHLFNKFSRSSGCHPKVREILWNYICHFVFFSPLSLLCIADWSDLPTTPHSTPPQGITQCLETFLLSAWVGWWFHGIWWEEVADAAKISYSAQGSTLTENYLAQNVNHVEVAEPCWVGCGPQPWLPLIPSSCSPPCVSGDSAPKPCTEYLFKGQKEATSLTGQLPPLAPLPWASEGLHV